MHPLQQRACDQLIEHPGLRTPPPEPEKPKPPRIRKPRVFKLPPKFPLVNEEFYRTWCSHKKELLLMKHKVDDNPPSLFPELYLKPRRLDFYARQLEQNMAVNKELLKKINNIQRSGGFVDCWNEEPTNKYNKLLCRQRQRQLDQIIQNNKHIYTKIINARSQQPLTSEMEEFWKDVKRKLIASAQLPFILFDHPRLDRGICDPKLDKPQNVTRPKVSLDLRMGNGAKIGTVGLELFTDIAPRTCALFLDLVKGDERGHSYSGTKIFRIVPDLYCRAGDVVKNNGFGCYVSEGAYEPMFAENYTLQHTVPGVLSMAVTPDKECCGHFNIIFKPLPQFDGKHVVFGRIVSGPSQTLDRINAQGMKLGSTLADVVIRSTTYYDKGVAHEGKKNTIKFPPAKH